MSKKIEVGDTVYIRAGLGEGQTAKVEGLKSLPFGTGIEVTLDGDYYAYLNPANLEVVPDPRVERIADLEAQITRLQAYVEELEFTIRGEYPYADEMITEDRAKCLHSGDLDPIGGDDEHP